MNRAGRPKGRRTRCLDTGAARTRVRVRDVPAALEFLDRRRDDLARLLSLASSGSGAFGPLSTADEDLLRGLGLDPYAPITDTMPATALSHLMDSLGKVRTAVARSNPSADGTFRLRSSNSGSSSAVPHAHLALLLASERIRARSAGADPTLDVDSVDLAALAVGDRAGPLSSAVRDVSLLHRVSAVRSLVSSAVSDVSAPMPFDPDPVLLAERNFAVRELEEWLVSGRPYALRALRRAVERNLDSRARSLASAREVVSAVALSGPRSVVEDLLGELELSFERSDGEPTAAEHFRLVSEAVAELEVMRDTVLGGGANASDLSPLIGHHLAPDADALERSVVAGALGVDLEDISDHVFPAPAAVSTMTVAEVRDLMVRAHTAVEASNSAMSECLRDAELLSNGQPLSRTSVSLIRRAWEDDYDRLKAVSRRLSSSASELGRDLRSSADGAIEEILDARTRVLLRGVDPDAPAYAPVPPAIVSAVEAVEELLSRSAAVDVAHVAEIADGRLSALAGRSPVLGVSLDLVEYDLVGESAASRLSGMARAASTGSESSRRLLLAAEDALTAFEYGVSAGLGPLRSSAGRGQ